MTLDELQKLCDELTPGPWEPVATQYCEEPYGIHATMTFVIPCSPSINASDHEHVAAMRDVFPKLIAVARAAKTFVYYYQAGCVSYDCETKPLEDALAALETP